LQHVRRCFAIGARHRRAVRLVIRDDGAVQRSRDIGVFAKELAYESQMVDARVQPGPFHTMFADANARYAVSVG
jgi:hypothetical protein